MFKKIALGAVCASVFLYAAWSITGQNKPQAPKGPPNMVSQTISRTTYVAGDKVEQGTEVAKKIADKIDVPGLTFVCHLYAAADQGSSATDGPGECALPYGAKIDTTFRQKAFPTPCAGGGATTNMTVGDVPQGIYLVCDGGYYWAVIAPIRLEALQFDDNGVVTQWGVHIEHLYCGPGGAPNGGCNVKLDVYAKLK